MSSRYVPPAMRKNEKPAVAPPPLPPPEKKFEDEFPALGSAPTTYRVWGGTTSFAEKAREWSEKAQKEADDEATRKKVELETHSVPTVRALPRFRNIRRFVEPEEQQEEAIKPTSAEDDEWTLVEKKVRKKRKTLTEIADEDLEKESEEETSDTVWNDDKELHETCWDERS